mmetsp:Transcript_34214/g.41288  ORF Transcript_34214/g.41288 Transcript_34214/m.41288 type:complete len:519 (-) Transcript_34214:241-1797(-)
MSRTNYGRKKNTLTWTQSHLEITYNHLIKISMLLLVFLHTEASDDFEKIAFHDSRPHRNERNNDYSNKSKSKVFKRIGRKPTKDNSDADFNEKDPKYWKDILDKGTNGFIEHFKKNMVDGKLWDGGTYADVPGKNTFSYVEYNVVRDLVSSYPALEDAGEITHENELAYLRLSRLFYPECKSRKDSGYCGIGLGFRDSVRKSLRPIMDDIYGSGTPDGLMVNTGNTWTKASIMDHARNFLSGKKKIKLQYDIKIWVAKFLHKISLDMDLSDRELEDFIGMQTKAVVIVGAPEKTISRVFLRKTLRQKSQWLRKYERAIREKMDYGRFNKEDNEEVMKLSWFLLDAHLFAGGLSVPSIVHSVAASYYTQLKNDASFDITKKSDISSLVMECTRLYPPVTGFPSVDKSNHRTIASLVMAGLDSNAFGQNTTSLNINRMSIGEFHEKSVFWADTALPLQKKPWTARLCPAKSLSFNMISAFIEVMDLTTWKENKRKPVKEGPGTVFWSTFELRRKKRQFKL